MNGRRAGAAALVATLVLVSSLVALGVTNGSYRDTFAAISYSGSDGTLKWSGPWVEFGESNGPTAGDVRVVSSNLCPQVNCIRITKPLLGGDRGLERQADLSGAQSATLSFDYRRQVPLLLAAGTMSAQIQANSASPWTTLKTYPLLLSDSAPVHDQLPIDTQAYASSQTQIRFLVQNISLDSEIYIDNVTIDVVLPDPATTTTTTTTTTLLPITTTSLTLPTLTTTTTLPILTTTTTLSATTTTTSPSRTTTTTSAGTSATTSPSTPDTSAGDADEGAVDESTLTPPIGAEEIARAGELGVVVGLEPPPSRNVEFALGLNPQLDLLVNFRSVVELIASEGVEALVLGTVIGFFAILGIKDRGDEEAAEPEDEDPATQAN